MQVGDPHAFPGLYTAMITEPNEYPGAEYKYLSTALANCIRVFRMTTADFDFV